MKVCDKLQCDVSMITHVEHFLIVSTFNRRAMHKGHTVKSADVTHQPFNRQLGQQVKRRTTFHVNLWICLWKKTTTGQNKKQT